MTTVQNKQVDPTAHLSTEDIEALGCAAEIRRLHRILREGTSADRQLRAFQRTGHLHSVVDNLAAETLEGVPEVSLA